MPKPKRGQVAKNTKAISKLMRDTKQELKTIDSTLNVISIATNWTWYLLNGCAAGTKNDNRIGDTIKQLSEKLFGRIQHDPASVQSSVVRLVILKDMFAAGAEPVTVGVFTANTVDALVSHDPEHRKRYKVLSDRRFVVHPSSTGGAGGAGSSAALINTKVKIGGDAFYIADAAAVASAGPGAMWLGTCGGDTATPTATISTRYEFEEK